MSNKNRSFNNVRPSNQEISAARVTTPAEESVVEVDEVVDGEVQSAEQSEIVESGTETVVETRSSETPVDEEPKVDTPESEVVETPEIKVNPFKALSEKLKKTIHAN